MENTMQVPTRIEKKTSVDKKWTKEFLERHHLLGHAFMRTQDKMYYPYWKNQLSRNSLAREELQLIGQDLARDGVKVFLLKGFSLMGEVYNDWGERYVSDIDLLVGHDELWKVTDVLKMFGYRKKRQERWLGNRHKHIFYKKAHGLTLTIEIHTQIFWHASLQLNESLVRSQVEGFYKLNNENQLIHLCGHVGFQNAYKKLFWLLDIFKFVEKNKDKINWQQFWEKAQKANLYKACYFTLFLCQKMGLNIQTILYRAPKKKMLSIKVLKRLVSFSYLYKPERYPFQEWLVRFLIKDSLFDTIRYSWAWLKTFKRA